MNRLLSAGEFRLGLRLILKQPVLSFTVTLALGLLVLQLRSVLLISIPDAGVLMPASIFLILAFAGAVAGWLPARRALGIRPSEALNAG
jgi:hypothetical protein